MQKRPRLKPGPFLHQNILFAGQELVSLAVPFCFIFLQTAFSELLHEFIVDFLGIGTKHTEVERGPILSDQCGNNRPLCADWIIVKVKAPIRPFLICNLVGFQFLIGGVNVRIVSLRPREILMADAPSPAVKLIVGRFWIAMPSPR